MNDGAFINAVESVASGMARFERENDGYIFTTGAVYPSGSPVRVRVSFDGNTCFVSDMGVGSNEAEMIGASPRQFGHHARATANHFGVGFDSHSFFVLQISIDRIAGAVKIVSAASHRATVLTEAAISEQSAKNERDLLVDKLIDVYGKTRVERDVEMVGMSGHVWPVAGRVQEGRIVAFDIATPFHSSVFSAHTKFSDLKLLGDEAPMGVVAVESQSDFKPDYITLLKQSASVIEIAAANDNYQALLETA